MSAQTLPSLTPSVDALRSPERVLHSIAVAARLEGMASPRRISFDEPTPVAPLPILSLTWTSLADMRPWLPFFHAGKVHEYVREDGSAHHTAYATYCGWELSLNAVDTVACTCGGANDPAHQLGCPAVQIEVVVIDVPRPACTGTWYGEPCTGEPVVDGCCPPHAALVEVERHFGDHFGAEANHEEAVRLNDLPRRNPGAALLGNPPPSVLRAAYSDDHARPAEALLADVAE